MTAILQWVATGIVDSINNRREAVFNEWVEEIENQDQESFLYSLNDLAEKDLLKLLKYLQSESIALFLGDEELQRVSNEIKVERFNALMQNSSFENPLLFDIDVIHTWLQEQNTKRDSAEDFWVKFSYPEEGDANENVAANKIPFNIVFHSLLHYCNGDKSKGFILADSLLNEKKKSLADLTEQDLQSGKWFSLSGQKALARTQEVFSLEQLLVDTKKAQVDAQKTLEAADLNGLEHLAKELVEIYKREQKIGEDEAKLLGLKKNNEADLKVISQEKEQLLTFSKLLRSHGLGSKQPPVTQEESPKTFSEFCSDFLGKKLNLLNESQNSLKGFNALETEDLKTILGFLFSCKGEGIDEIAKAKFIAALYFELDLMSENQESVTNREVFWNIVETLEGQLSIEFLSTLALKLQEKQEGVDMKIDAFVEKVIQKQTLTRTEEKTLTRNDSYIFVMDAIGEGKDVGGL